MNKLISWLTPYWQISWQPSKAYLWANVILWLGLWGLMTIAMQSMVDKPMHRGVGPYVRIVIDAVITFLPLHFLLRPYLKLYAIPRAKIGLEIIPLTLIFLVLSYLLMWFSVTIARLDIFGNIDMSQMQVYKNTEQGKGLQFVIKDQQLLFVAAINNVVMASGWAGGYWLYHALAAKKAMQKQVHQAQLQQLTNQLNPHFLFNALNSIRALIFEDQHKAAETVTRLSELFRTHLQAHLKPLSSVQDEWQLASQYLAIEQIRFEQRLRLQVDIAPDCFEQQLPTLTLLTVLENAIKHGVSPNSKGGDITLTIARSSSQRWSIRVANSVGAASREQGTRTGLVNIQRRLELQHPKQSLSYQRDGDTFSLQMELVYDPNPHRG